MIKRFIKSNVLPLLAGAAVALTGPSGLAESTPAVNQKKSADAKSEAIEVPRSEFSIPAKAGEGRDPFFPLSRRMVVEAKPTKGSTPNPVAVTLTLKGISRTESKRFALINDKTFEVGEERDVFVGESKVRVLCVEIREDSTVVEVSGNRQELRLKPGL